jgi:Zn-dependent protease with chaperone function
MRQQISPFEFVRLVASLLLAAILYVVISAFGGTWSENLTGAVGTVAFLFLALFLPALLAVFVASLLPTWRYKLIAATLMLIGITLWGLWDVVTFPSEFWALVGALIRLSAAMTGALLAVLFWRERRRNWAKSALNAHATGEPATQEPTTSPILLWLALISIPLTYITLFASAFLVIGYSALLLLLLFELPSVPVVLIVAAFLAPIAAGWVALRALWAQLPIKPPFQKAQTVPWTKRPLLNAMIKEVCQAVGARLPDNVIFHIEPTFFVTQQRLQTFDQKIRGRTLAISMPLLPMLSRQELQAVLAHEFAHFSGRDTLYSIWVSPVFRSLGGSITRLQSMMQSSGSLVQTIINLLLIPPLMFLSIF